MPVEIREIVIKTVIHTKDATVNTNRNEVETEALKQELLDACKRMINQNVKRTAYKR
ncbi:MAG: hypothetical protein GQ574_13195 [Crocinitomix sp.]|nr:hypothetical protein [Crocinitomix sp.]